MSEEGAAQVVYDAYGFSIGHGAQAGQAPAGGTRWGGDADRRGANKIWDKFMEELVDTGRVVRTRQLKLLVREGVPGTFRSRLWPCLAGTAALRQQFPPRHYEELLLRTGGGMPHDVRVAIDKDLRRTFPGHRMFAGPDGLAALRRVLVAYSAHAPSIGYCQSLNFVVAMLLLFVNEEEAFWLLDTMVQKLLPDNYYTPDMGGCLNEQECLRHLATDRLRESLRRCNLLEADWEVVTCKWFLCIFVNCLPLATTLRVWDVFFHDGAEALMRISLAIFKLYDEELLEKGGRRVGDSDGMPGGGGTGALASLQCFAATLHDVDKLFQAAFADPRCRVKVAHLQKLRRSLVAETAAGKPQYPGAAEHGQEERDVDKAAGAGVGKKALFRSWRFGLKNERGKWGGDGGKGGGKDAEVELLEGRGDYCRKILDASNPYDHLNDEEGLYSGQEHQGSWPSSRVAANAHCRAEVGGDGGEGDGCGGAGEAAGERVEGDRDDASSRTMYKAPSYFALLRYDSEPLDFAITDGYLSLSVSPSAASSEHGSQTAGMGGAASAPLTVPVAKPAHGNTGGAGRTLFAAWRRRDPVVTPTQSSDANDKIGNCPAFCEEEGAEEEDVDSEQGLAPSPWDSGISLDRGFFDQSGSKTWIRQGAMQQQALMRVQARAMGRASSAEGCDSKARRGQRERDAVSKHHQARGRRYSDESDSLASRQSDMAADERGGASPRRVLPRVTFSPQPIPPEMDPTRPPIEVGTWKPAGVGGQERRQRQEDERAMAEVCPSARAGVRDTPEMRDVCRENWRPNVPETSAEQVSCRPSNELLHAKFFENIDFIEEYLELYNFAS